MHSCRYLEKEQSLEMLHQGMQGTYFSTACSLKTQPDIHKFNNPGDTVPPRFIIMEMINSFNDHTFPRISSQEVAPIVNNVRAKIPFKPYDYTNKVQCECCHTFGHNIGDQICRTGAHTYHSLNYQKTHPKEFKDNTESFNNMHLKSVVRYVSARTTCADEVEHENEREAYVQAMAKEETSSESEQEDNDIGK